MMGSLQFLRGSLALIVLSNDLVAQAALRFCHNGTHHEYSSTLNEESSAHICPYGILFEEPMILGAIGSGDSEFCVQKDVCSEEPVACSRSLQYAKAQWIVAEKPNQPWKIVDSDSSVDSTIPQCTPHEPLQNELGNDYNHLRLNRKKRQADIIPVEDDASRFGENEIQSAIEKQTHRLFYFLGGINTEEVNSDVRVIQLFHASIRLVHMICDSTYLKEEFLDTVEKAFLFMLKEQGVERITDVDTDDYVLLRRALEYCMADPNGYVEFRGSHCPVNTYVDKVSRNGTILQFNPNDESNFVWGSYDVTIDAAWHIIDIVHGMCFATFRENLNLHHKYQVAMEQLFRNSIFFRWPRVTKLKKENVYDNMFLSPVNKTMTVLDACAQGAYIGSPFLHRLERPLLRNSRKKRSAAEPSVEAKVHCLKSQDQRSAKVHELKLKQCHVSEKSQ